MNEHLSSSDDLQKSASGKFQKDFIAGLVVFLVALPLCLGIALASDAPLASGLLAGIIGGLIVGSISGSSTSVSGPAAGLTAVVSVQIATMGGFEAFLTAVFLAGVIQIGLGLMKAGTLSAFFPSSVIKGLLAAIGTILILKQIPHFFGDDNDFEGEMSFIQPEQQNTFSEILTIFQGNYHLGALLTGSICIAVLVIWPRIKFLKKTPVPPALAVVLLGVGMQFGLAGVGDDWKIDKSHRVDVPVIESLSDLFPPDIPKDTDAENGKEGTDQEKKPAWFAFPDFRALGTIQVYIAALTIAIVASLETLLNLEAVDKLDPKKRNSPASRELIAQGVGNSIGGLIGSLPVTSVIIRSSVNIQVGGETKRATIIHGIFLVLSVGFFANYLNYIPLSSLAAILLITGYKLANPKLFLSMWKMGYRQFLPFMVTLLAIVFTDLLVGVIIGMGIGLLFILVSTANNPLRGEPSPTHAGESIRLVLAQHVSFLCRHKIKKTLDAIKPNSTVIIDGSKNEFIDEDTLEMIGEYIHECAADGIHASTEGLVLPDESSGGLH
ncbi:MAG: SulP family inorganic anion transporter [Planctomycetota bacterium]|nr:SulP family inorganic anion transporter [Planctomycetota bacterium]